MLKWKTGAYSGDDFELTNAKNLGGDSTQSICLTKCEKYLLIGSNMFLCVFELKTRKNAKTFNIDGDVMQINLIQDGTKALIATKYSDLHILDIETMEISLLKRDIIGCSDGMPWMYDNGLDFITLL